MSFPVDGRYGACQPRRFRASRRRTDDDDGAERLADDAHRDAAEDEPRDARPALRAEDEERRVRAGRRFHKRGVRRAVEKLDAHRDTGGFGPAPQRLELFQADRAQRRLVDRGEERTVGCGREVRSEKDGRVAHEVLRSRPGHPRARPAFFGGLIFTTRFVRLTRAGAGTCSARSRRRSDTVTMPASLPSGSITGRQPMFQPRMTFAAWRTGMFGVALTA